MMKKMVYTLHDFVQVSTSDSNDSYPFNLVFKASGRSMSDYNNIVSGPGVYLITFNSFVIYIGKFRPLGNNIFTDRWLRHIETITMRGNRVGFKTTIDSLNQRLSTLSDPDLKVSLLKLMQSDSTRLKDTGVVTSINRMKFADNNWSLFKENHNPDILNNFQFTLIKLNINNKDEAAKITSEIEHSLLNNFKPTCNREYHSLTDKDQEKIDTSCIVSDVEKQCKDLNVTINSIATFK